MAGTGDEPFLGVDAGVSGPAVVRLRTRAANGGSGKMEWIPPGGSQTDAPSIPFALAARAWQEVTVKIPAAGPLGILRVYLPAQTQTVDVDWIELEAGSKSKRWEF